MEEEIDQYPLVIQDLIKNKLYAQALAQCAANGLNTNPIQKLVKKEIRKANNDLENKKYDEALKVFLTTIGAVEPSMVLCKFFGPHLTPYLTTFLIELHKKGYATEQHTRLLFHIFHQDDLSDRLKEFIELIREAFRQCENKPKEEKSQNFFSSIMRREQKQSKKGEDLTVFYNTIKNTIGAAIEVLCQNNMESYAFEISSIMPVSSHYVSLLIENQQEYEKAANLIYQRCRESDGRQLLTEHGPKLLGITSCPECVNIIEKAAIEMWQNNPDPEFSNQFLKLFWGYPASCLRFLTEACKSPHNDFFATCLIDLLIPREGGKFFGAPEVAGDGSKALELIQNPEFTFDERRILFVCIETRFVSGTAALLQRMQRPRDAMFFFMRACDDNAPNSLSELARFAETDPPLKGSDWAQLLHFLVGKYSRLVAEMEGGDRAAVKLLQKVVSRAVTAVPLTSVVSDLCEDSDVPFEVVKEQLNGENEAIRAQLEFAESEHELLSQRLEDLEREIKRLEGEDVEFRQNQCDVCGEDLKAPYVAFMCGHCVHRECAEMGEGNIPLCPMCHGAASSEYEIPEEARRSIVIPDALADADAPGGYGAKVDLIDPITSLIHNGYFA